MSLEPGVRPGALRLRPVRVEDESAALEAHDVMAAEGFDFLLGHDPGEPWDGYVRRLDLQRRGVQLAPGLVPATFLLATLGDRLVGRVSVRHRLNEFLRIVGGHIGFGVLPAFRRRGLGTEMLSRALPVARTVGVGRVLVTCDDDNVGSAAVIERCGGVLDSVVERPDAVGIRRYWIA